MNPSRRGFLGALAALPVIGPILADAAAEPATVAWEDLREELLAKHAMSCQPPKHPRITPDEVPALAERCAAKLERDTGWPRNTDPCRGYAHYGQRFATNDGGATWWEVTSG